MFKNDESKNVKIQVYLTDLKEFRYYVVDENEESDEYDDSLSIIAMCVTPSHQNKLLDFGVWYDGEDDDNSGMRYITMELRDTDQFNVSAWTLHITWFCATRFSFLLLCVRRYSQLKSCLTTNWPSIVVTGLSTFST